MKYYFVVVATLLAVVTGAFVWVHLDRALHDFELRPSTTKVEGTQHYRKYVSPPPRSSRYQRWVDLPMNHPSDSARIKCRESGRPNRFDTLQRWDKPRISTALVCKRIAY